MLVVFGGSFNPPTIAHFKIAQYLENLNLCDQFFFLPVGNQYPKKELIASTHRIKMLKLVCNQLNKAEVCEIEARSKNVLTTFETLNQFQKVHPKKEIAFVLGADNLKDLKQWSQFEELIKNFKLIVFKRDKLDVEGIINCDLQNFKDQFIILDSFGEMDVSSSLYRESLENEHLILNSVSEYVQKHKLYGRV